MKRIPTISGALARSLVLGALTLGVSALPFCSAYAIDDAALPSGGNVVGGSAALDYGDARLDIYQNTDRVIIEWNSFNIGAGATTQFHQPGSGSMAVNRIVGGGIDPTMILGSLRANGQVIVLDPNGVIFGQDSVIDVGGIIASTGNINDHAFMAGSPTLDITGADTGGSIINHGTITVAQAGIAAFVAPSVKNSGIIQAKLGNISLASGDKATLDLYGDGLVEIAVDGAASKALIENTGTIAAEGGTILMSAKAAGEAINSLVNLEGVTNVSSVHVEGGRIIVNGGNINLAKDATLDASGTQGGSVELYAQDSTYVAGSIFASGGNGGFIETSAIGTVDIADGAIIDTGGGTWLIDPTNFTIANSGGNITTATLAAQLASNNITIETATAGADAGDIFVNSALSWSGANTLTLRAHRNIEVNQAITNTTGGSLLLRADKEGSGTGTITFGGSGSLALSGGGRADLYYNPTAYTTPTNYAAKITGTYTAWMLVNNVTQLQAMNTNLAGAYALGKDIDASITSTWNAGAGFNPIGDNTTNNSTTRFRGMFDGLGHIISNLFINRPATNFIGLFGFATGATFRNVGLQGGSITGDDYVGGLVGSNGVGSITNSYTTIAVTGDEALGGLLGSNSGTVTDSYANGSVTGTGSYAGGLIGNNGSTGTVTRSYATGSVTSGNNLGGLVGRNAATVSNSYATGVVWGNGGNVGGLVGYNYTATGLITDSYASGSVTGSGGSVGGLVGYNAAMVENAYATGVISGSGSGVGGLVGNNFSIINTSFATGNVTGTGNYTGGLVGLNYNNVSAANAVISNSYATGNVSGTGPGLGGLTGANSQATIINSYSTGSVPTTGSWIGGLSGANWSGGIITNSYWNTQTSGHSTSMGGTGLTTAQMKQMASFSGWSIRDAAGTGTTWRIYEGYTAPLLANFLTALTVSADNITAAYSGTPWSGGTVSYSGFKSGENASNLLGTLAYGGSSQGVVAPGSYILTLLGGLYSGQQGYDIRYGNTPATLTIQTPPVLTSLATSKGILQVSEVPQKQVSTESVNNDGDPKREGSCLAAMSEGGCVVQ